MRTAAAKLISGPPWSELAVHLTYASTASGVVPSAADIAAARTRLAAEIPVIAPKAILALGRHALRALGVDSEPGMVINATFAGHRTVVVPTFSVRELVGAAGHHFAFLEDMRRAFAAASPGYSLPTGDKSGYLFATTPEDLAAAVNKAIANGFTPISIAIATVRDAPTAVAFAWEPGKAVAVALDTKEVSDVVTRLLTSPNPKVLHDTKRTLLLLERVAGWRLENASFDTLAGQHLLTEEMADGPHLADLARLYCPELGDAVPRRRSHAAAATIQQQVAGAALDADRILRVSTIQQHRMLSEDPSGVLEGIAASWSIPVSRLLAGMESSGVPIDNVTLEEQLALVERIGDSTKRYMQSSAGPTFNPASPDEVATAFERLGVKPTDEGHAADVLLAFIKAESVDIDLVVASLLADGEVPPVTAGTFAAALVAYRKSSTARTTHLESFKKTVGVDGRAHPEFHIDGTVTGRISSGKGERDDGTSFQNIANDESFRTGGLAGVSVKRVIRCASLEKTLLQIDVKAAEIRALTAYAPDPLLVRLLCTGLDIHCAVASEVFGDATYEDYVAAHAGGLDDEGRAGDLRRHRTHIKRVVFGTIYGSTAYGIAQQISGVAVPDDSQVREAQQVIDKLFARMPSLVEFTEATKREANEQHFVTNRLGRRRRFPHLALGVPSETRARCHRQAVNFKVQSLASDLLVGQLAELNPHLDEISGRALLTVHDSGLFEIDRSKVEIAPAFFRRWITDRIAERHPWLPVPFEIDISVGDTYGDLQPITEKEQQHARIL